MSWRTLFSRSPKRRSSSRPRRTNALARGAMALEILEQRWALSIAPTPDVIVGESVFYNNSHWDGYDPAANAKDDAAIATDKSALTTLGATPSLANYTSYDKGINGLIIDIQGDSQEHAHITADNFQFSLSQMAFGINSTPAPAPQSVSVRLGEGVGGSDRVEIIWPDGAIQNTWLATTYTQKSRAVLVYFGGSLLSSLALEVGGNQGFGTCYFGFGTSVYDIRDTVNQLSNATGVVANVWNGNLYFRSVDYGPSAFVSVKALSGTFITTDANSTSYHAVTRSTGADAQIDPAFVFGNQIGSSGLNATGLCVTVNGADQTAALNNQGSASITNPYDYNRDSVVNAADASIARNHFTNSTHPRPGQPGVGIWLLPAPIPPPASGYRAKHQ